MASIEEFTKSLGLFITEKIRQNAIELSKSLRAYKSKNKKTLEKEVLSFEYFIWDYILHSLCSKSRSENRIQASDVFDKLRDEITKNIIAQVFSSKEMDSVSESCDAYRKSLSKGTAGDSLMNLGFEFCRISGNHHDPALAMVISGHFGNMWKYMPSTIEKQVSDYLNSKC